MRSRAYNLAKERRPKPTLSALGRCERLLRLFLFGLRKRRVWRGVPFLKIEYPLDAAEQQLPILLVGPDVLVVPQAHVHDFAVTVILDPQDGNVTRLLERSLFHVQAHQHADLVGLPVLELINFVLDFKFGSPRFAGRVLLVVDGDGHHLVGMPGMAVERAAEHVPIALVVMIRVGRRVNADEAVALLGKPFLVEVVEMLLFDREIASRVEEDDVVILEVFLREILLCILRAIGAEQIDANANVGHGPLGGSELTFFARYRAVLEVGALGEHQKAVATGLLGGLVGKSFCGKKCEEADGWREKPVHHGFPD